MVDQRGFDNQPTAGAGDFLSAAEAARALGVQRRTLHGELAHVIHGLGSSGGAVIVGRGAQSMLPADRTLRVRVVAPLEVRIAGLVERRGLDGAGARAELVRIDRERPPSSTTTTAATSTSSTAATWWSTATLGLAGAADLVVAACRARFPAGES